MKFCSTLLLLMSVLLAGCGSANTRTQSSSPREVIARDPIVVEHQNAPVIVDKRVYIYEDRRPEVRPRYPYSVELYPPQNSIRSDVVIRDNGEIYHITNGRVSRVERPSWTQKRRD